jgi:prolyl-tRNA synthetase
LGINDGKFCLPPSQEEAMIQMARGLVHTYRELPLLIYQISDKFRDDRPAYGILQSREFSMLDTYSFDHDKAGLEESYRKMYAAYVKIIDSLKIRYQVITTDGAGGKNSSTTFFVASDYGKNSFLQCKKCDAKLKTSDAAEDHACPTCGNEMEKVTCLRIADVSKLGTVYSRPLDFAYAGADGQRRHVEMGGYGFTFPRYMAVIIEQNHDSRGIIWPLSVAPFEAVIIPAGNTEGKAFQKARQVYDSLKGEIDVAFDDRDISAGKKFFDADLMGIPYKLIVGGATLTENTIELESRVDRTKQVVSLSNIAELKKVLRG